jgi:CheY-like chemotaxis protein
MRFVIADDSDFVLGVWRSWLRKLGHEIVGEAFGGRQAVSLCAQYCPDVAMLDMSMGEYGGEAAAEDIRREGTASHIIIASSMSSMRERMEAKGYFFIAKPIGGYQILATTIARIPGSA